MNIDVKALSLQEFIMLRAHGVGWITQKQLESFLRNGFGTEQTRSDYRLVGLMAYSNENYKAHFKCWIREWRATPADENGRLPTCEVEWFTLKPAVIRDERRISVEVETQRTTTSSQVF